MPSDEVIELMVQAAMTDAFHQRGLNPAKEIDIPPGPESYQFMGVDLKQVMRAALAALAEQGWTLSRQH